VTGIDLKKNAEGDYFCFEVNPSPGFLYYEKHSGQPICAAIAELLNCGHKQSVPSAESPCVGAQISGYRSLVSSDSS
jgi:hypothetical protein